MNSADRFENEDQETRQWSLFTGQFPECSNISGANRSLRAVCDTRPSVEMLAMSLMGISFGTLKTGGQIKCQRLKMLFLCNSFLFDRRYLTRRGFPQIMLVLSNAKMNITGAKLSEASIALPRNQARI